MKARSLIPGIAFFCVLLLATCTFRANDPSICFSRDVLPILATNCGGCHGKYTYYEGIMKDVVRHHPMRSELYKVIHGSNPKMPPESHQKLTSEQVYIIKAWISMGAENTSSCGSCDTSLHKFSADIFPIMDTWCTGPCHTTASPDGGYDLSYYNAIKSCGQGGKLMNSINHAGGAIAMPQGGGKIDDCDIQRIQNWVNAGYPNN